MEKGKKTPATGCKAERERLKTRDKERDREQKNSNRPQGREGGITKPGQGAGQERDEDRQITALCYSAERKKLKNRDQRVRERRHRTNHNRPQDREGGLKKMGLGTIYREMLGNENLKSSAYRAEREELKNRDRELDQETEKRKSPDRLPERKSRALKIRDRELDRERSRKEKSAAGYQAEKESLKMGTARQTEREGERKEATGDAADKEK